MAEAPRGCDICGGSLAVRFPKVVDPQTKETFSILSCLDCGLGHTDPVPADLTPYYGNRYHGNRHGITDAFCVSRRLRLLKQLKRKGADRKLLDVGCGDGAFLLGARRKGWQVVGTELKPDLARAAGLEVYPTIEEAIAHGPYDCVTLWHSLEHLVSPSRAVGQLKGALKPDGALLIAVPDADGLQAKLFGPQWFHLDVPRHLFHFGDRSLGRLLTRAGLVARRKWHQELEYDLMGWTQSALNTLLPTPNVLFSRLTGKGDAGSAKDLALSLLLGPGLSAAAVPLTTLGSAMGRGGTLVVAACHA